MHGKKGSTLKPLLIGAVVVAACVGAAVYHFVVPKARTIDYGKTILTPNRLMDHCEKHIGAPRVEKVSIWGTSDRAEAQIN